MAVLYTSDGMISLEGRGNSIFENGDVPVNMPHWENFKGLAEQLKRYPVGQKTAITDQAISECFNPIIDPISGLRLRSSTEQFEMFCRDQFIKFRFDDEHRSYLIEYDYEAEKKQRIRNNTTRCIRYISKVPGWENRITEVPLREMSTHAYRVNMAEQLGIEFNYYWLFSKYGDEIVPERRWKGKDCAFGMNKEGNKIILVEIETGKILKWTYLWWSKFLAELNYRLKWRRTNT